MSWTKLLDALVCVERLEASDSGLLAFGLDPAGGGIFVENGRICWAAAPGMQRRLRDLLEGFSSTRGIDFTRVYERCRAEGKMLGQTLVEEGLITPSELEAALRRHSAESLIALCANGEVRPTWTSRGARGYSARFTFKPLDLLLDVAAVSAPELAAAGHAELAGFEAAERHGGAFIVERRHDMVPIAAFGDLTVHELWTLGRWASSIPHAMLELGTTPSFTLAATAGGETVAVWWRGALLYAVACGDRRGVTEIIARHLGGAR